MKTILKTDITAKDICKGFVYNKPEKEIDNRQKKYDQPNQPPQISRQSKKVDLCGW